MLRLLGIFAVAFAALAVALPAHADDPGGPFRAKLAMNAALARRAASSLGALSKQAAPKKLSPDHAKAWKEQSRTLATAAARFAAMKIKMDHVLAKGAHAPASEMAQVSLELGEVQEETARESGRFEAVSPALRARHEAAMRAIR